MLPGADLPIYSFPGEALGIKLLLIGMAARKRNIKPGGTRGTVFREVAHVRLKDAAVLLEQGRFAGAIYLAGYAVECLLKWAITCRRECVYLPAELEIHNLDKLMTEAGLERQLSEQHDLPDLFWRLAEGWGPELRYLAQAPEAGVAMNLYREIERVYYWIVEHAL